MQTPNYRIFNAKKSPSELLTKPSADKYFAFNQSIHAVMTSINRNDPKSVRYIKNIDKLLQDNWVSKGYVTRSEEETAFIKGVVILGNYVNNPLDIGIDNIIIDKNLSCQIKKNGTLSCRIDKVYETEEGKLEIVDYKTGRIINHIENFDLDLRTAIYIVVHYENLKVFPDAVSYYYLRYNKKFTRILSTSDLHLAYKKIHDHYKFVRETLHLDLRYIPYASY
jgi:ATP-dependent exoDNAse (exonuclease V) beta subunit